MAYTTPSIERAQQIQREKDTATGRATRVVIVGEPGRSKVVSATNSSGNSVPVSMATASSALEKIQQEAELKKASTQGFTTEQFAKEFYAKNRPNQTIAVNPYGEYAVAPKGAPINLSMVRAGVHEAQMKQAIAESIIAKQRSQEAEQSTGVSVYESQNAYSGGRSLAGIKALQSMNYPSQITPEDMARLQKQQGVLPYKMSQQSVTDYRESLPVQRAPNVISIASPYAKPTISMDYAYTYGAKNPEEYLSGISYAGLSKMRNANTIPDKVKAGALLFSGEAASIIYGSTVGFVKGMLTKPVETLGNIPVSIVQLPQQIKGTNPMEQFISASGIGFGLYATTKTASLTAKSIPILKSISLKAVEAYKSSLRNLPKGTTIVRNVPETARPIEPIVEGVPKESVSQSLIGYQAKLTQLPPERFGRIDIIGKSPAPISNVPVQTSNFYGQKRAENIAEATNQLLGEIRSRALGNIIPRASIRRELRKEIMKTVGKTPAYYAEVMPTPSANYFVQRTKDIRADLRALQRIEAREGIVTPTLSMPRRVRAAYREGVILKANYGVKKTTPPYFLTRPLPSRPTEIAVPSSSGRYLAYRKVLQIPLKPSEVFGKKDVAPFRARERVIKRDLGYLNRAVKETTFTPVSEVSKFMFKFLPSKVRRKARIAAVKEMNYGIKKPTPPSEFKGFIMNVVDLDKGVAYYEVPKPKRIFKREKVTESDKEIDDFINYAKSKGYKPNPGFAKENIITREEWKKLHPDDFKKAYPKEWERENQGLVLKLVQPKVESKAKVKTRSIKLSSTSNMGGLPTASSSQGAYSFDIGTMSETALGLGNRYRSMRSQGLSGKVIPLVVSESKQPSSISSIPGIKTISGQSQGEGLIQPQSISQSSGQSDMIDTAQSVSISQGISQSSSQGVSEGITSGVSIRESTGIRSRQSTRTRQFTTTQEIITSEEENPKKLFLKKLKMIKKKSRFITQLRRFGKFRNVAVSEDVGTADLLGKKASKAGLGASYRIFEEGRGVVKPRNFNQEFYSSRRESGVMIQKRGYRLGTLGERKEIKTARAQSNFLKGGKSKWF